MRNLYNLKLLMVFSLITTSNFAFAEQSDNSERRPVASSSASPTINAGANQSKSSNSSTATLSKVIGVANMGIGAMHLSAYASCSGTCASELFKGILHIAMGAMSFKQASSNSGAGYSANISGIDTADWKNPYGDPNAPGTNPDGSPTPYVPGSTDLSKDKGVAAAVNLGKFDDIRNQLITTGIGGVKLDPKTGKLFDKNSGKTYDANTLGNAQAMADAGFSAGDIASATSASSAAEKAAMKKLGLDGGTQGIGAATAEAGFIDGAGSGGTLTGNAGDVNNDSSGRGRGVASSGGPHKIASGQVAGLTKNFNGERIGVSAENIFDMMTRRYKTKEKQNSFFDPSERVKMPQ